MGLVDRYLLKKKSDIYDYSKLVNEMLTYEGDQIWKSKDEFSNFLKSTISYYVDNYYFESISNFEEYKEYLGPLVKCDDRFKTILVCALNSINKEGKTGNYILSVYVITIIVYTGVILNRFTYPFNNYQVIMDNVSKVIESMYKYISFVKYESNHIIIKKITRLIKSNNRIEKRFFENLNELNNDNSKNEYQSIDSEFKYYKTLYKYKINNIDWYDERELKKSFKRVSDDLIIISYELVSLSALKSIMLNKNVIYLFPAHLAFYEKDAEINKLSRNLNNKYVKNKIKLFINYDDYTKHKDVSRKLINEGFELAFNFDESFELPYSSLTDSNLLFVDDKFIEMNKGNIDIWKESGIMFIIKSNGEIITESKLLEME